MIVTLSNGMMMETKIGHYGGKFACEHGIAYLPSPKLKRGTIAYECRRTEPGA